jgi:hypothetical protein
MKALLNRIKTAFLFKVLTVLSRLSAKIRAEIAVDYAIRGSIMANRGRSIPRPPMVFVNRSFSRRKRQAAHHFAVPRPHRGLAARWAVGMGKFPLKIEFDGDDDKE